MMSVRRALSRLRGSRPLVLGLVVVGAAALLAAGERGGRELRARLFLPGDGARWIWAPGDWGRRSDAVAFLAAADFQVERPPSAARLLVQADEEYVLHLNGRLVGCNRYRSGAPLDAYRVESLLVEGRNRLVAELRSGRGAGGLLFSLADENGTILARSGREWRIFAEGGAGVVRGWRPLADGEPPRVWGAVPTGRWSIPTIPESARRVEGSVLPADAPLAPRRVRSAGDPVRWRSWSEVEAAAVPLGEWSLWDWGRPVRGHLLLRLAAGEAAGDSGKGGRGLLFTGSEAPDPRDPAAGLVVLRPGAAVWRDAAVRSFRFVLVVADRELAAAHVLPAEAGEAEPPGATAAGLLGIVAPPLWTPAEEALRYRMERAIEGILDATREGELQTPAAP